MGKINPQGQSRSVVTQDWGGTAERDNTGPGEGHVLLDGGQERVTLVFKC